MTDQQRFDQVGYESDGYFETPNIDELAQRGVVFSNTYSAATTCVPARVSLLTGLQHHRVPTQVNLHALREGFWTVAHALRHVGYETALIGKMHFAPVHAQHGFDTMRLCEHLRPRDLKPVGDGSARDVDDYHDWLIAQGIPDWRATPAEEARPVFPYDAALHPTGWVESETLSFLEGRDRRRPLLLVISFPPPHAPRNPPEPYASMYDPADTPLPRDGFEVNERLPPRFREAMSKRFGRRFAPRRVSSDEAGARALLTSVRALMRQVDDSVGRIVDCLDMTRSVVFFTSDHGDYGGHRGMLSKVPWIPFDDLARVPLVVAGRGVVGGRHVSQLVQSYDFTPTCLEYAGIDLPGDLLDAQGLCPWLQDQPTERDLDRAVVCATTMGWPMVRRGPLKYVVHRRSKERVLFDLDADPGETTSVLDDPAYGSDADELSSLLEHELARETPDLPSFGTPAVAAGSLDRA